MRSPTLASSSVGSVARTRTLRVHPSRQSIGNVCNVASSRARLFRQVAAVWNVATVSKISDLFENCVENLAAYLLYPLIALYTLPNAFRFWTRPSPAFVPCVPS